MNIAEYKEIIAGLVAIITVLAGQYFQYLKNKEKQQASSEELKKLVTDKDSKQDEQLKKISERLDGIEKTSTYTYDYTEELKSAKKTRGLITIIYAQITNLASIDNSQMLLLLENAVKLYSELTNTIIEIPIEKLTENYIDKKIDNMSKSLWDSIKWTEIDTNNNNVTEKSFKYRLRHEVITPFKKLYIQRIKEDIINDAKKYNGTFSRMTISIIEGMLQDIIQLYRDCKK